MKNLKLIFIISLLLVVTHVSFVVSLENKNKTITIEEQAILCVNESKLILNELKSENFSVLRINDSLKQALNILDTQKFLKAKQGKYDFSPVLPFCNEIKKIREMAFESRDDLNALKTFYKETITESMNSSSADLLINEIESEIQRERYEKVKPLVESAYNEIADIKTSQTTLNLFYKTTTRNIKDFFMDYWKIIVLSLIFLIILFIIYQKTISKWWIKRKIDQLEMRKTTIKNLMMKTQHDYFETGNMSESSYEIRTKKFAELIRDLDRQIPLLRMELIKIDKKELTIPRQENLKKQDSKEKHESVKKNLNKIKKRPGKK